MPSNARYSCHYPKRIESPIRKFCEYKVAFRRRIQRIATGFAYFGGVVYLIFYFSRLYLWFCGTRWKTFFRHKWNFRKCSFRQPNRNTAPVLRYAEFPLISRWQKSGYGIRWIGMQFNLLASFSGLLATRWCFLFSTYKLQNSILSQRLRCSSMFCGEHFFCTPFCPVGSLQSISSYIWIRHMPILTHSLRCSNKLVINIFSTPHFAPCRKSTTCLIFHPVANVLKSFFSVHHLAPSEVCNPFHCPPQFDNAPIMPRRMFATCPFFPTVANVLKSFFSENFSRYTVLPRPKLATRFTIHLTLTTRPFRPIPKILRVPNLPHSRQCSPIIYFHFANISFSTPFCPVWSFQAILPRPPPALARLGQSAILPLRVCLFFFVTYPLCSHTSLRIT